MKIKKIKVVAFDCDGVLFDTNDANRAYYNRILERMDLPPMTDEQFAYVQMNTIKDSLVYLCGEDRLDEANSHRRGLGYTPFIKYMKKEPGIEDVLARLDAYGLHKAIATNRSNTMNQVLEQHGLADRFDMVVTALDVMRPKPAPEQLLKILDYFDAEPAEMLYIGDSELDSEAARSAGVIFTAYKNPELDADFCVNDMEGVQTVVDGLLVPALFLDKP